MTYSLEELALIENFQHYFVGINNEKNLKKLRKINFFVGENNSGKSRFIRNLSALNNFRFSPPKYDEFKLLIAEFYNKIEQFQYFHVNPATKEGQTFKPMFESINKIRTYLDKSFFTENDKFLDDLNNNLNLIRSIANHFNASLASGNGARHEINKLYCEIGILLNAFLNESKSHVEYLKQFYNNTFIKIYMPILRGLRNPLINEVIDILDENLLVNNIINVKEKEFEFKITTELKKIFTLGLEDIYKTRTLSDYFNKISFEASIKKLEKFLYTTNLYKEINSRYNLEIFTGIELYSEVKKMLLGKPEERDKIEAFQEFIGANFFNGRRFTLMPRHDSDVLFVMLEGDDEYPIYDLGDGIQSVIILTFPLFKHINEKLLVFIEEPEIYLHPGMQRIFIDTLLNHKGFEKFQFFFTTHSNHLLDLILDFNDISIFTLKKISEEKVEDELKKFHIENVECGDHEILKLLGVNNSSVFLSNCTIWVEGLTDRLYLSHYFNVYQNHFNKENNTFLYKEDLHYSFVEYSGGNITHWSFLEEIDEKPKINYEKICYKIFLIADSDKKETTKKTQGKKAKRHEILKKRLGNNFYLLECTEIENLISKDVFLKTLLSLENQDNIDSLNLKKSFKTKLEKNTFNRDDYKLKSIGKFIDQSVLQQSMRKSGKYQYSSNSGTLKINDKEDFCKIAIENTVKYEDLSDEIILICGKMYDFIESSNKHLIK
jgi:predicted ATP-dependent endonuclease of OLD family